MGDRGRRRDVRVGPNEVLRFALEVAGLVAMGIWGWNAFAAPLNIVTAIGVPLAAAAAWGTFRVPNDPGPAPVAVPGAVRLALEIAFFTSAALMLYAAGQPLAAVAFAALTAFHYGAAHRRVAWLVRGVR